MQDRVLNIEWMKEGRSPPVLKKTWNFLEKTHYNLFGTGSPDMS